MICLNHVHHYRAPRESNTQLLNVDINHLHEVEAFLRSRMLPLKTFPHFLCNIKDSLSHSQQHPSTGKSSVEGPSHIHPLPMPSHNASVIFTFTLIFHLCLSLTGGLVHLGSATEIFFHTFCLITPKHTCISHPAISALS